MPNLPRRSQFITDLRGVGLPIPPTPSSYAVT